MGVVSDSLWGLFAGTVADRLWSLLNLLRFDLRSSTSQTRGLFIFQSSVVKAKDLRAF